MTRTTINTPRKKIRQAPLGRSLKIITAAIRKYYVGKIRRILTGEAGQTFSEER